MKIRDRIRGFVRLQPEQIRSNPRNWRTHPEKQRNALKGVLADVGIVDAVLVRELDDGTYMLVDGHLRTETIRGQDIPALVLDIDDREEAEVLATLDPLAALAEADGGALIALLNDFNTTNPAVLEMVNDLFPKIPGVDDPAGGEDEGGGKSPIQCPHCARFFTP